MSVQRHQSDSDIFEKYVLIGLNCGLSAALVQCTPTPSALRILWLGTCEALLVAAALACFLRILSVRDLAKSGELFPGQFTELAALAVARRDCRKALTPKLRHGMVDVLEDAPDEPISAFSDGDLQPSVAAVRALDDSDLTGRGAAVFQPNTASDPIQGFFIRLSPDLDHVALGDMHGGVRQLVREIAIVGEQEHALSIHVETTDRLYTLADAFQQIEDALSLLGVIPACNHTPGLVQQVVHVARRLWKRLSIDCDVILRGDGVPGMVNGLGIDLDTTLFDHCLGLTAAGKSRASDHFRYTSGVFRHGTIQGAC